MILLLYAHPHPRHALAGRVLLEAVSDLPQLTVHSLYDAYPDFSIDAAAERERIAAARLVVWQHPLYWYGPPALMKLWFETVLVRGWAYGPGGDALRGKDCLWVTSTGAGSDAYSETGLHGHLFGAFAVPVSQTARFCAMNWLDPIVVHGGHRIERAELDAHAQRYRARLQRYLDETGGANAA